MKFFRTFLGILVLSAYAGCTFNSPSVSTLSYIASQQGSSAILNQASEQPLLNSEMQPQHLAMKNLSISTPDGQAGFHVQVADNELTRATGLMFRTDMPANEGMIFLFDEPQQLTFWMKNTLIPLDMIFIDNDWKVVSIQKSAQPCKADPCVLYPSEVPAKYVLEINAGLSDKLGIQKGATVQLQ